VRSRSRRDSLGGCSTCSGGCTLTATQIRVSADYPVNSWPIKLPAPAGTPIWSWLVPWGGTTEDRHLPIEEPAMYGNILSQITQFLTPDVIAKLAQGAGISDRAAAQKAVGAAVPTILSGLAGLAAKPDGARQLADAVARQPADMLDKLASMTGGTAQIADTGKSMLSSLFGSSMLASLAGGIARFVGIDETAMRSLLGMLTPALLGMLGREAGS
jgi:hypothetical protein